MGKEPVMYSPTFPEACAHNAHSPILHSIRVDKSLAAPDSLFQTHSGTTFYLDITKDRGASSERMKKYNAESNELVAWRTWGMAERRRTQQSRERQDKKPHERQPKGVTRKEAQRVGGEDGSTRASTARGL
jgi:hypothetical protein